ncbi:MAG: hypothetical protein ACTSYR_02090 [Candidatus Odinarchaeia archaeon]
MIKCSFEVPVSYLKKFDSVNDYHFILAHIALTNKEYQTFFKRSTKYKILDNGALELGASIKLDNLVKLAIELKANVIVLPDVWMDSKKTYERSIKAFNQLIKNKELKKMRFMFVPQGKTLVEFRECLKRFIKRVRNKNRLIIGLPYLTCAKICSQVLPNPYRDDDVTNARIFLIQKIPELKLLQIHLLGAGENVSQELSFMRHYSNVKTIDTSTPFVLAMKGVKLDKYGLFKREIVPGLNFNAKFNKKMLKLAKHNAYILKQFVRL